METDQQQAQVATASSQPAATSQQSQAQPESTPSAPPPSNSTGATQQAESSSTAVASSATASRPPTAPAAPASPPLPTRHTPQAPGPRAARFQKVLDDSLKHTLGKVTWENFASCYPTVAERAPATLKAAQRQMVDRLAMLCKKEFDSILTSRNVVNKLNELEGLVSEAELRRDEAGLPDQNNIPTPPHLLPASAILAAHLQPHLVASQSQLNARLQTTQSHNARLWTEIQQQRAELSSLTSLLEKLVKDLEEAGGMLDDAGVQTEIAKETREVESEMMMDTT
ncbi:uncharacterized protein PG998_008002 [Apiospora kogelbergensis]|uniref:Uncharacterized protein n=1 Tax=Apiospora kogelbergensis TaxID=1337665 RepID=A0AAW0QBN7_9PEZI